MKYRHQIEKKIMRWQKWLVKHEGDNCLGMKIYPIRIETLQWVLRGFRNGKCCERNK